MEKITFKNLDKSNWKTYRFDQIARKISDAVDPNTTELDIYIGLEHLDSESIHVNKRGTPSEVGGGKLKCYPGDIIFGKRRAYLRKAALVDFEGICSAHAFVLRAIPEVMNPRLFPFFLHSDLFMHCAVDISVGGLSPTINWGQLKEQEFLLPPKDVQPQLTELLWAMDDVLQLNRRLFESINLLFQTARKGKVLGITSNSKHIGNFSGVPGHWNIIKMDDIFERISEKNKKLSSNNVLTISASDGLINQEEYFKKSVASKDLTPYYLLTKGDFAYNKSYSDGYPAGAIKCLNRYEDGVVSPLYICFRS
jgi:restriction endonuclease S subunit